MVETEKAATQSEAKPAGPRLWELKQYKAAKTGEPRCLDAILYKGIHCGHVHRATEATQAVHFGIPMPLMSDAELQRLLDLLDERDVARHNAQPEHADCHKSKADFANRKVFRVKPLDKHSKPDKLS